MGGYVYIIANRKQGAIYTGMTVEITQRILQHRERSGSRHAKKYDIYRLVYAEFHDEIGGAIAREKAIKKWRREWKITLIERDNPDWRDLFFDLNR